LYSSVGEKVTEKEVNYSKVKISAKFRLGEPWFSMWLGMGIICAEEEVWITFLDFEIAINRSHGTFVVMVPGHCLTVHQFLLLLSNLSDTDMFQN